MARLRKIGIREKDGKYVVDYYENSGRRVRTKFYTREAAEKEKARLEELASGVVRVQNLVGSVSSEGLVKTKKKIKDGIKDFVATCPRRNSEHFKRTDAYHFEQLFEYLHNVEKLTYLHEVEQIHMDKMRAHLVDRELSPSTINRWFATYKPFFNKCLAWGFIAKTPTKDLARLQEKSVPVRDWSPELVKGVMEILDYRVLRAARYIATTGCRPIDMCRANWGDIDLGREQIRFVSYKGGKTTETFSPMPGPIIGELRALYEQAKRSFRARDTDPVFLDINGKRWTTNSFARLVREAIRTCGVTDRSLYGLRHSFCQALVDAGVHPRDIQVLARHKKFETTTRYTKRNVDHLRSALDKISVVS